MKTVFRSLLSLVLVLGSCRSTGHENKEQAPDGLKAETFTFQEVLPEESLYNQHCGSCHQRDGSGVPGMYPSLVSNPVVSSEREYLIRIVLEGVSGPVHSRNEVYSGVMPPQDYLTDEEISLILSYVRKQFGNIQDPVTLFEVEALRNTIQLRSGLVP
jgi:cytochrome c553